MKRTSSFPPAAQPGRAAKPSGDAHPTPDALPLPAAHASAPNGVAARTAEPGTHQREAGSGASGDAYHIYFREVGRVPLLTPAEQAELIRQMRAGDMAARKRLITSLLRLVVKTAHSFEGLGVPLLDLISEGNIGLMKAVDRVKPGRGASLVVYASFWIQQRIRQIQNAALAQLRCSLTSRETVRVTT